ncbi:bifunctional proline dehydrogenase/L-glutamate gamma-semialdehyde dehydrogenase [Acidipropionibacterium jensenii]|uniref:bifunctional proline dehydrogenase/L-glutamate gamma-semialdehyde dehydrogenase n=1 Tax=Acidipropionibacterium jensenii TaxID=1749 RepID=UPI0026491768|nr:bifunctional proline dehydrogenase/L-glutamate gamma-semialdehyde dehydrogenase [Acidipropionibacterium jensenii]MDN5995501.1 bifunctional proline dehydrogenase/L-glutamate gamma-semialdehyde dehydrogenase [Acidipropionibacterium jensenii]
MGTHGTDHDDRHDENPEGSWSSAGPRPVELADEAVQLARRWALDGSSQQGRTGSQQLRTGTVARWRGMLPRDRGRVAATLLSQVLREPSGLPFTVEFIDRVMRPEEPGTAAAALARLSRTDASFLPPVLRAGVRMAGRTAPHAPRLVVGLARGVLRQMVGHLIIDARPRALGRALRRLRKDGVRLNLNLLGEAVLGDREAAARLAGTKRLLARDDVDYVSVKISAVVNQLDLWAHDATVQEVADRLAPLFRLAARSATAKFINLDMEEYHDLDLTIDVFQNLLDRPEFLTLEAGIVLQAYLPDSLAAAQRLTAWADRRTARGGAGIKIRLVKGANLPMEKVDAELHGWAQAPWHSKVATDSNYLRVLDWALTPERTRSVRYGVAGHNLFSIAMAKLLADRRGVGDRVEFEMLLGMVPDQVERVGADVGGVLLYTPVVHPDHFDVAISYLVRRLEEGAAAENFMSAVFELGRDPDLFSREEARFRAALDGLTRTVPAPNRHQEIDRVPDPADGYRPSTDSDPALAPVREWAAEVAAVMDHCRLGATTVASHHLASVEEVDDAVATGLAAQPGWNGLGAARRAEILREVAAEFARRRGDLLAIAGAETGKIVAEGDVEISEAIDFATWYANHAIGLEQVDGATFTPPRLTVVAPPWNFPLSITAGSVLAPLAAGSAVLLKPAPQARRCAAVIAECLWGAGVPREVLQLGDAAEDEVGRRLISHPDVERVILTGAHDTATLFRSWRHDLPLLAETSGKNAIIVTENADYDLAAADIVRSAFGNAGQKCSAASLVILVGQAYRSKRLRHQILDAAASLRLGDPSDLATQLGPLIQPAEGKLLEGLTTLDPGQTWALRPRRIDPSGRFWSPGVRAGVRPGDRYHLTEYFGPITGIMSAPDLATAVSYQNGTPYGLTAGIHSLDPAEISWWLDHVQAGNLYINRGITGAIVGRQPFGGWKKSAVGPGAKAGGPNYLAVLGSWAPAEPRTPAPDGPLSPRVEQFLSHITHRRAEAVREGWLWDAAHRDAAAWAHEFGIARDIGGLIHERDEFRYRPAATLIRIGPDADLSDAARACSAGLLAAGPVLSVSLDPRVDPVLASALTALGVVCDVVAQPDWLVSMGAPGAPRRVRLIGADPTEVAAATAGDPDLAVWSWPVTAAPRVELLAFLREQSVSLTAHRFGTPSAELAELAI